MVPLKVLFWNSKFVSATRFPILTDIVPVNLLLSIPRLFRVVNVYIKSGMVPDNPLLYTSNVVRAVRLEKVVGIGLLEQYRLILEILWR